MSKLLIYWVIIYNNHANYSMKCAVCIVYSSTRESGCILYIEDLDSVRIVIEKNIYLEIRFQQKNILWNKKLKSNFENLRFCSFIFKLNYVETSYS